MLVKVLFASVLALSASTAALADTDAQVVASPAAGGELESLGRNYVGVFSYNGGSFGGTVVNDLAIFDRDVYQEMEVYVSGGCGLSAQVLHTSPYPVAPTILTQRQWVGAQEYYRFSINNGQGVGVVGVRGYISGYAWANCRADVYLTRFW